MRSRTAVALGILLGLAAGCERARESRYVSAPEAADLDSPLQQAVRGELEKRCGTPQAPKMLSAGDTSDPKLAQHLKNGAAVYERYCVQCHGASGDGNGQAARYLNPKPRDYRRGIFKFTSTGYGHKPRREDLLRTVTRGVRGTSMPSFERLPKQDLEAVIDYVLALTHRGELETLLIAQAQSDGELTKEAVDELVPVVLDQWQEARHQVVEPATKMPDYSPETVAAGAAIFQKRECFKCHGRDGRGGLAGNIEVGQDAWGNKTAAADLTSGMLHGGSRPIDVYRRIYAGINGTPMPAFKDILSEEPESVWQLVHFVLHLSDERRHGVPFPAGSGQIASADSGAASAAPQQGEPGRANDPEPAPGEPAPGEDSP